MNDWKLIVGKISDRDVARVCGVSASTVRRYRLSNGIPAFCPRDADTPPKLIEKLATESNYQLSRTFKVSLERIKAVRAELGIPEPKIVRERFTPLEDIWSDEAVSLLGTMPDTEIADRLGTSNFPVKQKRAELGIAAYKRPLPEITLDILSEFATVSDVELAQRMGVSASYVRRARVKMRS